MTPPADCRQPGPGCPTIIQGGMGVGVSGWRLARAVAAAGQLGVVSGVGLDILLARRLQLGDPDGHLRRALAHFPVPSAAEEILARYYVPGGIGDARAFRAVPKSSLRPKPAAAHLAIAGNFAEVYLAKEGHNGPVGINYLEKLQMATPAAVYGALLAGVDYVLMGAGIPAKIPGLLDALAAGQPGEITVDVGGAPGAPVTVDVDPDALGYGNLQVPRPRFVAIVSSNMLAVYLVRDDRTRPDGFVVEGPNAGGHSARPRGPLALDDTGQPLYGPRDHVELEKMSALGIPYWVAGGQASPDGLRDVLSAGAAGIQVGSAFALCAESDLDSNLKTALIERWFAGTLQVRSDPVASPTGFPFKVAQLPGTVAEAAIYSERKRLCDAGALRVPYRDTDGSIGYRCPAEPPRHYVRKGGQGTDTAGRMCLCNGLIATIGLPQRRQHGKNEPPLVTIGQDLSFLQCLCRPGRYEYKAVDVIDYLDPNPLIW